MLLNLSESIAITTYTALNYNTCYYGTKTPTLWFKFLPLIFTWFTIMRFAFLALLHVVVATARAQTALLFIITSFNLYISRTSHHLPSNKIKKIRYNTLH